jgi:alkanesulfonate monooxygenase SsuD/methylene tetrahydromethanopterin reductase-like flavin-dependent oxidoreductase (luciferase family)
MIMSLFLMTSSSPYTRIPDRPVSLAQLAAALGVDGAWLAE